VGVETSGETGREGKKRGRKWDVRKWIHIWKGGVGAGVGVGATLQQVFFGKKLKKGPKEMVKKGPFFWPRK